MTRANDNVKLLALDCGSQSCRALLFDAFGDLIASSKVGLPEYDAPHAGWSEIDPAVFWQTLVAACNQLWSNPAVDRSQIAAVSLTTQRATMINLDDQLQPLRPAITWLDKRRCDPLPKLPKHLEFAVKATGAWPVVKTYMAVARSNWIAQNQPEVWQKTDKFVMLSGYLTHLLSGRLVDSVGSQVGYVPFDYKKLAWAGAKDPRWKFSPLTVEQLPQLVQPGDKIGQITDSAAAQTGIPAGLPLIAAAADKACEVLGSGCFDPKVGHVSYGTTATYNTCNSKYVEPTRNLPAYPAAIPQTWNTEIQLYRGYWLVSWFKNEFAQLEAEKAKQLSVAPEVLLDSLLQQTVPGAQGLVMQPYWASGPRIPGPEARGAVIGFAEMHTRADLYRSIIEGIAYALHESRIRIEKRNGLNVDSLRVSGGGATSDAVMQITADVFGLPAQRPKITEASGLGAAMNAAVGVGLYSDYQEATKAMVKVGDVFNPNHQNHQLYSSIYSRVYKPMYGRLRPLYRALREITGYPE